MQLFNEERAVHARRLDQTSGRHHLTDLPWLKQRARQPPLQRHAVTREVELLFHDAEELDLRPYVDALSKDDLVQIAGSCLAARVVDVSGWSRISMTDVRVLTNALGSRLLDLRVADTAVTDNMIKVITVHADQLTSIDVSRCRTLSNTAMRALAEGGCRDTLRRVTAAGCAMDHDGLGWLAGSLAQGLPCRALRTLSFAGCALTRDVGVAALGRGCPRLEKLSLADCAKVSDAGIVAMAAGCARLQVLNLTSCAITDASLEALAAGCPDLRSLNAARCRRLTDAGVVALGEGCARLEALNVAGCQNLSERAMQAVASPQVRLVNLSGCRHVTETSLQAVAHVIPTLRLATSFFGLIARDDIVEARQRERRGLLEHAAATHIQAGMRGMRDRARVRLLREEAARRHRKLLFRSAVLVQRCLRRFYSGGAQIIALQRRNLAIRDMQRVYRGHRARMYVASLTRTREMERHEAMLATRIQSIYRGHRARTHNAIVRTCVSELRCERDDELTEAFVVRLQALYRQRHARKIFAVIGAQTRQRRADRDYAARLLQRAYRGHRGRSFARVVKDRLSREVGTKTYVAEEIGRRWKGVLWRRRLLRLKRMKEQEEARYIAIITHVQAVWRGFVGRKLARRVWEAHMRDVALRNHSATVIQKTWHGFLVPPWREIRLIRIRDTAAKRQAAELRQRLADARKRMADVFNAGTYDSASEDEAPGVDDCWIPVYEAAGSYDYYNERSNRRHFEVPDHAWELELLGVRCRVMRRGAWLDGTFARYNRTKWRMRVEYLGTDVRDWINLEEKQADIQVQVDGVWMSLLHYNSPAREAHHERLHAYHVEQRRLVEEHEEAERLAAQPETLDDDAYERKDFIGVWDDEEERMRWLNKVTGEMFNEPRDLGDWEERFDENSGDTFYHNVGTGEVSWERPVLRDRSEEEAAARAAQEGAAQARGLLEHARAEVDFALYAVEGLLETQDRGARFTQALAQEIRESKLRLANALRGLRQAAGSGLAYSETAAGEADGGVEEEEEEQEDGVQPGESIESVESVDGPERAADVARIEGAHASLQALVELEDHFLADDRQKSRWKSKMLARGTTAGARRKRGAFVHGGARAV